MKSLRRRQSSRALILIICFFAASGALRVGGLGLAVASETETIPLPSNERATSPEEPQTAALLELIARRTAELDAKERKLQEKSHSLNAAQLLIEQNLVRMAEAEAALAASIAKVDGAAEGDLERLTNVYESMKPKIAAALFEQMTPEFAAGFLGRMSPQGAAGIMSSLSSEASYAISVVLAGRHVNTPTK